jgi:hypothetical protein
MPDRSLNIFFPVLLALTGLGLLGGKAYAGDVDTCTVGGGTLAFGNYQPSNGNRTTVGSVQMSCTCRGLGTTTVSGSTFVALSDSSSNANRLLQNLGSTLTYGVYSDANYSNVYPSVAGSAVFSFTGNCPLGLGNSRKPLSCEEKYALNPQSIGDGRLDVGHDIHAGQCSNDCCESACFRRNRCDNHGVCSHAAGDCYDREIIQWCCGQLHVDHRRWLPGCYR